MKSKTKKTISLLFLRIIPALLVLYFIIFTGFYIAGSKSMLREWNFAGSDKKDSLQVSSEEWELIHERAFLNARLAMSGTDSIGLTLNLKDSLVQLEMKGVVLRQIKYDKSEMSKFFHGIRPEAYTHHFSKSFSISEIEGSIEKNPVIVRKVPKDSLEAAQTQVKIDTSKVEFVEWHLLLDSALLVSVVQSDQFEGKFHGSTFNYRLRRHMKTLKAANQAVFQFRKPEIFPEITVFIPANEAKSFFRALPPNGQVVLRL
jgi:hypothetical protein